MLRGLHTAVQLKALKADGLTNADIIDLIRSVDPDARVAAVEELARGLA